MKATVLITIAAEVETNPQGELALIHIQGAGVHGGKDNSLSAQGWLKGSASEVLDAVIRTAVSNMDVVVERAQPKAH